MATASALHGRATLGLRHPVHNYEYADATARTTATGFEASDVGKVARQLDDDSFWVLNAVTPTWTRIDGGSGGGGYETVQNAGTPLTQRTTLNATSGLQAADDTTRTNISPVYGSSAGTVCQGDDARLSDSRAPNGSAGGQLGGTYPNPDVRGLRETGGPTELTLGAVVDGQVLRRSSTTVVGASVGSGANTLCAGDDARLSDDRTAAGIRTATTVVAIAAAAAPSAGQILKATSGTAATWQDDVGAPVTASAPVNVTKAAAVVGVATDAARADHKHDVTTAAPSTGIGGSNAEGSSTSLARADHDHTLRTTTGPTDLTIGALADGEFLRRVGTAVIGSSAQATLQIFTAWDQKTAGDPGGTATAATWNVRTLNTVGINTVSGMTLSANTLTDVPAGTYLVYAVAPAFKCDTHRLRIRNTTDSTDVLLGSIAYAYSVENPGTTATLIGAFTLGATKNLQLQHYLQTTPTAPNDVYALGSDNSDGLANVFATIVLVKVS